MNNILQDKWCCGCTACESICPNSAISISDKQGFYMPKLNSDLCTECGLCVKVCPGKRSPYNTYYAQKAFAAVNQNDEIRTLSTSGGAFSALAEAVISKGGIIYGAVCDGNNVIHKRTTDDYGKMRGSKYLQSRIGKAFLLVEQDLKNGVTVLFSGTPCQCAGLKKYLNYKRVPLTDLITVDFICHGVVSPGIFKDYIDYCNKKSRKTVKEHIFRSKIHGWTKHTELNIFTDGTTDSQSYASQLFKSVFYSHLGMNDACFECRYASINRESDITMGDFWGIKNNHPELFDESGVSFLLVNTQKGMNLLELCKGLTVHDVDITDVEQPQLYGPAKKPEGYEDFWNYYNLNGFNKTVKKYYHGGTVYRMLSNIYRFLMKR